MRLSKKTRFPSPKSDGGDRQLANIWRAKITAVSSGIFRSSAKTPEPTPPQRAAALASRCSHSGASSGQL